MRCPKCTALMKADGYDDVIVDVCTGCMGIWFDGGELERLKAMGGAEHLDKGDAAVGKIYDGVSRAIECPRCMTALTQVKDQEQPHIRIDYCTTCAGVFLDAGELTDLMNDTLMDRVRGFFARWKK